MITPYQAAVCSVIKQHFISSPKAGIIANLIYDFSFDEKIEKEEIRKTVQGLEEGIVLSEETLQKVQRCFHHFSRYKEKDGVRSVTKNVFTIDSVPDLFFKTGDAAVRYNNTIEGVLVNRAHQWGLLVISHAKLLRVQTVDGKDTSLIAEQKLHILDDDQQEENFDRNADKLVEAIDQLAGFISVTGFWDTAYRNTPLLEGAQPTEKRKIALIDLQSFDKKDGAVRGLFGSLSGGLVSRVSEKQAERIKKIAEEHGVSTSAEDFARNVQIGCIRRQENQKRQAFYNGRGITRAEQSLEVQESDLD